jgi:hypothetical protein
VAKQAELAEQQAEYARGAADAEALAQQAIYEQGIAQGRKIAAAELLRKTGQAAADASIEDLMAQGGGAPAGMPPEMAGGMPPEAAGAMPPEAAGGEAGGGSITPEDLMAGLEAMVQEGTLKPEEAEAVLQYITQAGGGEGAPAAEGGAPEASPAGEGAAPAEAAAKPEEKKEDSSKEAQALLATIQQIRQAARK